MNNKISRSLAAFVDFSIVLFATWTLAYHLIFFSRLPAFGVIPLWLALVGACWYFFRPRKPSDWKGDGALAGPSILIGLLVAGWSMVVYSPFLDNYDFMHRAFWQTGHMREAFAVHATSMFTPNLPPISESHVLTSVEMIGAMAGKLLPVSGLWLDMCFLPAVTVFLGVCSVGLLGQFLGLNRAGTTLLIIGFVLGSLIGADVIRTVGMFGLPRISEGKCAMVFAGIPIAYLYLVRFSKAPTLKSWVLMAMVGACFVGWTSSGILLAPVLFLLAALSRARGGPKKAALLLCSGFYPVVCFVLAKVGPVPKLHDISVWVNDWPLDWRENVGLIARGPVNLWLQLVVLAVGVFLVCYRKDHWIGAIPLIGIVLLFNPVMGPVVIKVVPPAVFWRLGYMMCGPLGVGLCLSGAVANVQIWRRTLGSIVAVATIALGLPFALPGTSGLVLRSPSEIKWWPEELAVAERAQLHLTEPRVLASEREACILSLVDPSLRFDSVRWLETLHFFKNSAYPLKEGLMCCEAQKFLDGQTKDPEGLRSRVQSGLRQLIFHEGYLPSVRSALGLADGDFSVTDLGHHYCLLQIGRRH